MKRAWILLALTLFAYTANAQTVVGTLGRDTVATGNITTNGDSLVVDVQGVPSATIKAAGTWTGTLSFRQATDFGACTDTASVFTLSTTPAGATSATANGSWTYTNLGATKLCVTATATMTGTVNVTFSRGTAAAASSGGGGGVVNVADPNTPSQKAAVNASGQLSITCANCSGSGASAVDESAFTQGTNSVAPSGVLFKTSYTALTTGQVGIWRGFSDGSGFVMGSVASGATDAGNPLKIGGIFNTTPPTVTNGQRVDAQFTNRGSAIVATGADLFKVSQLAAISTSVTLQNAATGNANGTVLSTDGMSSAVLTVNCGSCSGGTTVNFEGTEDGTNYSPVTATQLGVATAPVLATTTVTAGLTYWQLPSAGLQNVRARVSLYSAGTVTITGHSVPVDWNSRGLNANVYQAGTWTTVGNVTPAQAFTNPTNAVPVASFNMCFNGSTWDRCPTSTAGSGVTDSNTTRSVSATDDPARVNAAGTLKSGGTSAMTGTTSTSVIAGTASNYLYISSCSVNNTHASVDTLVNLQDGSGGTTLWTFVAQHGYAGESHSFPAPLKVPTIGNGLFAADATTGASVIIFCNGFISTVSF